jgi:hypothetical protein
LSSIDIVSRMNAGGNAVMRSNMLGQLLAVAALFVATPAHAWLSYPDRDDPNLTVVEIEKETGETIALAALPAPFAESPKPGRQNLIFFWRYERLAEAKASFMLAGNGATATLVFKARNPSQDLKFGAVLILMDKQETAMHAFYARADLRDRVFASGELTHQLMFTVNKSPGWWSRVSSIAIYRMTYYPLQKLNDDEIWQAMRRAVGRAATGGTEQRAK